MLKLTIAKLSSQVFQGELPPPLLRDLRGAQIFICRRSDGDGIKLLTSASPHLHGQVLLIFPDKESVRLRSRDGDPYQMSFESAVKAADEGGCSGLVLMMGSAWTEMDLSAARNS